MGVNLNRQIDPLEAADLLERVRSISQRNKRQVNDQELLTLCRAYRRVA